MIGTPLQTLLRKMLKHHPAVLGSALVDAASGLVWHQESTGVANELWEAAADYWRLHGRLAGHFDLLGGLGAVVTYHRDATLALVPCVREPEVVLVCIAERTGVDWKRWQRDARALGRSISLAM